MGPPMAPRGRTEPPKKQFPEPVPQLCKFTHHRADQPRMRFFSYFIFNHLNTFFSHVLSIFNAVEVLGLYEKSLRHSDEEAPPGRLLGCSPHLPPLDYPSLALRATRALLGLAGSGCRTPPLE